MASNYTSNYGLCQWAATDKVLRNEFNADNAKIDAAIAALDNRVSGLSGSSVSTSELNSLKTTVDGLKTSKADKSALSILQTTVNGKADQDSLDALAATVSRLGSTLGGKGNCSLFIASYMGKGTYGTDHLSSLTLSYRPEIIFISSPDGMRSVFVQGQELAYSSNGGSGSPLKLTWTGNSVKWYNHMSAAGQLNSANTEYTAVVLTTDL